MSFKLTVQLSLLTVTSVLVAAATVLLIIGTDKLSFVALWVQGFMCLSVTLSSKQYIIHLSTSYNFKITLHICYSMF